jgi:hypothetical protein
MQAPPGREELSLPVAEFGQQPPKICSAYPDHPHQPRRAIRSHEIDLSLAAANQMNVSRFVIGKVDDESVSVRQMYKPSA